MSVGASSLARRLRGVADRASFRAGELRFQVGRVCFLAGRYLLLPVLDTAARHQLRVRQRCGLWRYRELMGSALVMPGPRQRMFQWRLRRCARHARVEDLTQLVDFGWRERLVAGWLIAAGRRGELRPRIAQDLSDPSPRGDLHPYCVALACLGTEQDARILRDYLTASLTLDEQDEQHCQVIAMAALLYLDHRLGTDHAAPLLAPGGPWARWPGSSDVSLDEVQQTMTSWVAFASGADPGIRSTLRRREEYVYGGK